MSFVYNETLVQMADTIADYEIPLFAILEGSPFVIFTLMSIILGLAIYTTAISGIFGLATRFRQFTKTPTWFMALILVLLMIPFTHFGFANLIAILYPLYGLVNLYLLVSILLFPILDRYKIR